MARVPRLSSAPPNQSAASEMTPLYPNVLQNGPKDQKTRYITIVITALLCLIIFALFFIFSGIAIEHSIKSKYYADMRAQWAFEKQQHRMALEKYAREEDKILGRIKHWDEDLREKKEQEGRAREAMRLYWSDVKGSERCEENGVMMYSGRLENLLPMINAIEACKATSVTIHGVTYASPMHCEDRGSGDIIGHWKVKNEAICSTYWEYFKDKGCLSPRSGFRRIEAPLGGLHPGANSERMCFTTSATMYGQHFERPTSCPYWGNGFWGIWNVPDDGCL